MRWFCGSELLLPLFKTTSFLLSQAVQEFVSPEIMMHWDATMKTIVQFGICLGPKHPWFMFKRTEGTSDRSVLHIVFVGQGKKCFGSFLSVKLQWHGKMKTHLIKPMKIAIKKNIWIQIESPHLQPIIWLASSKITHATSSGVFPLPRWPLAKCLPISYTASRRRTPFGGQSVNRVNTTEAGWGVFINVTINVTMGEFLLTGVKFPVKNALEKDLFNASKREACTLSYYCSTSARNSGDTWWCSIYFEPSASPHRQISK